MILRTPVYHHGKKVGEKCSAGETKWFETIRGPEHYFQVYGGFAESKDIIKRLIKSNINRIIVRYHGKTGNKQYGFNINEILREGNEYLGNPSDPQVIMTLRRPE